jgi:hypothetical protein
VAPAQAALLDTYLVPNQQNFFEDNSREAYFDVDNSGTFNVGDVLVGYVRIENRSAPGALDLGNTTYAIFSQQVASINGLFVNFAPTTAAGLTLSDVTGGDATQANAMVALYTSNYAVDLINNNPGDITGGGITLSDYLAFIAAGDLELTAGIAGGEDDFFQAIISLGFIPTAAQIATFDTSTSVAFFGAALSVLTNNTNFTFADDVCTNFFGTAACSDLTLLSGTVGGAANAGNPQFKDGSEFGYAQCGTAGGCGFIDNTDINVHPLAVPEPASMILFGLGLTALGIYGRRRMNRQRKSE